MLCGELLYMQLNAAHPLSFFKTTQLAENLSCGAKYSHLSSERR